MIRYIALIILLYAQSASAVDIQKVVGAEGIEAWLVEDHHLPLFAVSIAWKKNPDPKNLSGTTAMMAALLDQGAENINWEQFHAKLEDLSISMRFHATHDAIHGEMRSLTKNKTQAFDLLRQAITKPRFDQEAVEKIRRQFLTLAQSRGQDLKSTAHDRWYRARFGNQPYAFPVNGIAKDLRQVKRFTLVQRHQHVLNRTNLSISVVGDIRPDELESILDRTFSQLPQGKKLKPMRKKMWQKRGRIIQIKRTAPQTIIYFGLPGIRRSHPDFMAYYLMNYMLGGGSSSRLFQIARKKYGLVYDIHSHTHSLKNNGFILGMAATRNHQAKSSIRLIQSILSQLRARGISQEEIQQAKTYLIDSYGLNFDNALAIARNLSYIQINQLGIDYIKRRAARIDNVSPSDVLRQIRKFLRNDKMIIVTAGGKNNSHTTNLSDQK